MNLAPLLFSALASLIFVLNMAHAAESELNLPTRRPNVLLIVADDLRGLINAAGYPGIKTPVLDELAKSSITFRRTYCQYPVCGPSRASFMSGLYPASTGVTNNRSSIEETRPGTPSLPGSFRQSGYWTACAGKIFHRELDNPGGTTWDRTTFTFDDELPIERAAREAFEAKFGAVSEPKNKKSWGEVRASLAPQTRDQGVYGSKGYGFGPTGMDDRQHNDGKDALQVKSWLTDKTFGDRPFLIACGFHRPHIPMTAPQRYFDLYPKDQLKFDHDPLDDLTDVPLSALAERAKAKDLPPFSNEDVERRKNEVQSYHACVSFLDAQLGIIIETLKSQNLYDNTIIVFTGDHGYLLGEHFQYGKVMLFEEANLVPLIIRVPGLTDGAVSSSLTELVDIYPTLTALCSVAAPRQLQGQSLVPIMTNPKTVGKGIAYTVVERDRRLAHAIRFENWRYTEWGHANEIELYDLANDPKERTNLARNPAYQSVLVRGKTLLNQTQARAESCRTPNE